MARKVSRRDALRLGAASAVLPAFSSLLPASAQASPAGSAAPQARLHPFPLSDVALGDGLFADKRGLLLDFVRGYDENRLLQVFRSNAYLPTGGAVAPGGWEGLDGAGNGNLRGHFTGHFMTALAQAYASTGEPEFERKLRTLIAALHECREALRTPPSIRSAPGRFGTAIDFQRGAYLHLDVPGRPANGLRAMTFAAWVRPEAVDTWARILDIGNDTRTNLFLTAHDDGGLPRFAITRDGAGAENRITGRNPLPAGQWSHVAVVLAEGSGSLYVNGKQAGSGAVPLAPADLGSLAHCWIGRSHYDDRPFGGVLDDINLWSRALSPDELAALQQARAADTPAGPGDRFSFSCDEHGGTTAQDGSGSGRHAAFGRTWGQPSHPGFLAAYPETQFILLESITESSYPVVWAPYYTTHKILQGLLDGHAATGDQRALDLAAGMCDWMHSRLSRLTDADRQRMWGLFSSGEFGGIVEAILRTHALTGRPEHLRLAQYFDLNSLIDACADNRDVLDGKHANQHIPIFTGLLLMHDRTGQDRYREAARNFWRMVVTPRMFGIGGTSEREFFRKPGVVAALLNQSDAETCCAYNMLKLTKELFLREQDPAYADYYERALFNQVLGSKQDKADAEKPLATYFIGLQPGAVRDFTPHDGTTCCEGTGMENPTKYQDFTYLARDDEGALYVNLYQPSALRWTAKGVTVTQETPFPYEGRSSLRIAGSAEFALNLRVPAWVGPGFAVRVNGVTQPVSEGPGSYVTLTRAWRDGDVVEVDLPFQLRAERTPDDPAVQNLMYGPVNLVARDSRTGFLPFSLYPTARLSGDLSRALTPVPGDPLHFRLGETELAPFFEGTEDPFHAYFRREEPRIVFDSVDSGVRNPAGSVGTFLDEVWAGAPFANKGEFTARVSAVSERWRDGGHFTDAERDRIMRAAAEAPFSE
ncbi:beta-L-arabinofuranosidase domain-containing protein [Saccharopolyspora taberi]|uniref:LamG-like jellyroll fold domain-containing protein n=1 Tax=Saccharopolyspora taberi TaxID=60895 RepID=A0ABN3VII1_9PSEU